MRSLRDILTGLGVSTPWHSYLATGVSADGMTIVGTGIDSDGGYGNWMVTIPEPSATSLLVPACLLLRRSRRTRKRTARVFSAAGSP